jgi:hypothetical protein
MTSITTEHLPTDQQKQLWALNKEHRDTQEALNHAQASLNRAMRLLDDNYRRRRKQIMNGHGHDLDE